MLEVGFEPTPPKRVELESTALDHSAIQAQYNKQSTIHKNFLQVLIIKHQCIKNNK